MKVTRAFTNINPHDVASDAQGGYPSDDESYPLGVYRHNIEDGEITSGTVDFMGEPNEDQETWLQQHPHIGPYAVVEVD